MLTKITETEDELVDFIRKSFAGRYTELKIAAYKHQRWLQLWFANDEMENIVLDIQLPASAYIVEKSGDIVFIPRTFPLKSELVH